jgi:hypothetical protein
MRGSRDEIEAIWRALTSAAARRDPGHIATALAPARSVGLLQACGTAVLETLIEPSAGRVGADAVDALTNDLRERGWNGDGVLADLLVRLAAGEPAERPHLVTDPGDVGDIIESGGGGWLDLTTGYAWPQSSIDDDALDDVPGPDDDPDRWLELPIVGSRVAWQDMADFVDAVTDSRAAADLGSAVQGSSAFARFQRALDKHQNLRVHWRIHSSERQTGRARAWLADAGYDAVPPPAPA